MKSTETCKKPDWKSDMLTHRYVYAARFRDLRRTSEQENRRCGYLVMPPPLSHSSQGPRRLAEKSGPQTDRLGCWFRSASEFGRKIADVEDIPLSSCRLTKRLLFIQGDPQWYYCAVQLLMSQATVWNMTYRFSKLFTSRETLSW
jgi:hypothetical protein